MASEKTFTVYITRQDGPAAGSQRETFSVVHRPEMTVITVLNDIAARPVTADGKETTPVAWDANCLEEVCGSCTIVINGRVRQACTALVDRLLEESASITLEPMSKFPVVRDLVVDRRRMFESLKRVQAWISVDGYYHAGPGPRMSPAEQEEAYPMSRCMTCGCCLEACPQFHKIELKREAGESDEEFRAREVEEFNHDFIGAQPFSQAVMYNLHPTGRMSGPARIEGMMGPGGITECGNAQNCAKVCPKDVPLLRAIAIAGRQTSIHAIKRWFTR